jgi:hypothetical protein
MDLVTKKLLCANLMGIADHTLGQELLTVVRLILARYDRLPLARLSVSLVLSGRIMDCYRYILSYIRIRDMGTD